MKRFFDLMSFLVLTHEVPMERKPIRPSVKQIVMHVKPSVSFKPKGIPKAKLARIIKDLPAIKRGVDARGGTWGDVADAINRAHGTKIKPAHALWLSDNCKRRNV